MDLFLVRRNKPRVAHIWTGDDTACRMYSTGGLEKLKYVVADADLGLFMNDQPANGRGNGMGSYLVGF